MTASKLAEEVLEKGLKVLDALAQDAGKHPDIDAAIEEITGFLHAVESGADVLPTMAFPAQALLDRHYDHTTDVNRAYATWTRALQDDWHRTPAASAFADRLALWSQAERRLKARPKRPRPVGRTDDCVYPDIARAAVELRDDWWSSSAALIWNIIGDIFLPIGLAVLTWVAITAIFVLTVPRSSIFLLLIGFVPGGLVWWKAGPRVAAWFAALTQPKIDWAGHTLHLPGRDGPSLAVHLGSDWRLSHGFHKEWDQLVSQQRLDRLWFILHTEEGQRYMLFSDGLPWRRIDVSVPEAQEPKGADAPTDRVMIEPNDWVLIFNRLAALDALRRGDRIGLLDDLGMPDEIKKRYGLP